MGNEQLVQEKEKKERRTFSDFFLQDNSFEEVTLSGVLTQIASNHLPLLVGELMPSYRFEANFASRSERRTKWSQKHVVGIEAHIDTAIQDTHNHISVGCQEILLISVERNLTSNQGEP